MAEIASELANVLDLLDLDATRDVADPVFGAQLPLDLCLFILDSRPSSHYNHLKHILDFESSLLSTPSAVHMDENLDFQPSNFQSHFLPFSLPDDIRTQRLIHRMTTFKEIRIGKGDQTPKET